MVARLADPAWRQVEVVDDWDAGDAWGDVPKFAFGCEGSLEHRRKHVTTTRQPLQLRLRDVAGPRNQALAQPSGNTNRSSVFRVDQADDLRLTQLGEGDLESRPRPFGGWLWL